MYRETHSLDLHKIDEQHELMQQQHEAQHNIHFTTENCVDSCENCERRVQQSELVSEKWLKKVKSVTFIMEHLNP